MVGYIFGGSTGETPESLKRKREIANALARGAVGRAPRNIGEGLSAIGQALAFRAMEGRADKAASIGRGSADASMASLIANMGGGGAFPAAPSVPGTPSSTASAEPTDYPSERVASAFAASGGGDQNGFIQSILPKAMEASKATGVDPRIIVAQAALESGYGKHAPGNNLFGIKGGNGPALATKEVINGQPVNTTARFQQFASPGDSVQGYADFINKNPRYQPLKQAQGLDAQLEALGASGYATDPAYAAKVGSIARGIQLPQTATGAANALAAGQTPAPPLPAPVNVPDMPIASQPAPPQPVQVAQATNAGTPGQMSDVNALALLGASPVHPGQGNTIADLLRTASNPWLNKNASAVVNALLGNKLKQQDPSAQLDMRYKQAQLDQLLNPTKAPTVQSFYDPQTGQPYEAQWNPKTQSWDKVGGNKASSNGITVSPDGTVQIGGPVKPLTEAQSKDAVFFTRGAGALPTLDKFGNALTSLPEKTAGGAPIVGNYLKSKEYQQAENAGLEFLQAILRKDTGAAITPAETAEYGKVYLPQPGDSPEVLAQKSAARHRALAAIKIGLPPTAILGMEKAGVDLGQGKLPAAETPGSGPADLSKMPAPEGIDPKVWAHVPPEKRKLWLQ